MSAGGKSILEARQTTDANVAETLKQITSTTIGNKNALDVNVANSISVSFPAGGATEAKQDSQITILNDIEDHLDSIDTTNASIDTKLTTTNSDLATINTTLGSPMQNSGGSVTANAGTNLNTSALSLESTQVEIGADIDSMETSLVSIDSKLTNPLPVSGSISVSNFPADADSLAQASTTSGQLGSLVMGATTTSAPTYTTAQTNPLSLDTAGLLRVSLKDTPANSNKFLVTADPVTFASPQHIIVDSGTVTANIGTTNGLALDSSLTELNVALEELTQSQGSTTSGQVGPLIQAAVTTAAPSYTTAQTSPLSLTTAGALRTDASATTQPVSGTVTANAGINLNTSALNLEATQAEIGADIDAIETSTASIDTKLTTTNSSLASIDAGIPVALGQTTMANSMPVTMASDQSVPNMTTDFAGNDGHIKASGIVASMSTTTPLGAGASFTSPIVSVDSFNGLLVTAYSGGIFGTFSINWFNDAAGTQFFGTNDFNGNLNGFVAARVKIPILAPYVQIVFVNGATPQVTFYLTTFFLAPMQASDSVDLSQKYSSLHQALNVRSFPAGRDPETRNRIYKTANIENAAASTTIYTVTAGKTFHLTSIIWSIINTGTAARTAIEDNATVRIPIGVQNNPVGTAAGTAQGSHNFVNNPMSFTTSVRWVIIAGGTLSGDITIVGYEE